MKTFRLVKTATIDKMIASFANHDEYSEFVIAANQLMQEFQYLGLKAIRNPELLSIIMAKQAFSFAMFCRDNFDVISSLVKIVDYEIVTEDHINNLAEDGEIEAAWD